MSIPHSSSSATSRDDDVTEDDDFTEGDDVTEEDDADKVDVDATTTDADDVANLADDADVAASDVIAAVVSVTLLSVSPEAIIVAVTASFFDSDSSSNFEAFFSSSFSSICPSLIWASFRWKKEPLDGEERGTDTTRR